MMFGFSIVRKFVGCAVRTIHNRVTGGTHGAPYMLAANYGYNKKLMF